MRNVGCELLIDACTASTSIGVLCERRTVLDKPLSDTLVDRDCGIVILWPVAFIVGDVQVNRVVSRLRYAISIVLQRLIRQSQ